MKRAGVPGGRGGEAHRRRMYRGDHGGSWGGSREYEGGKGGVEGAGRRQIKRVGCWLGRGGRGEGRKAGCMVEGTMTRTVSIREQVAMV
jgi:hypothetical protein